MAIYHSVYLHENICWDPRCQVEVDHIPRSKEKEKVLLRSKNQHASVSTVSIAVCHVHTHQNKYKHVTISITKQVNQAMPTLSLEKLDVKSTHLKRQETNRLSLPCK